MAFKVSKSTVNNLNKFFAEHGIKIVTFRGQYMLVERLEDGSPMEYQIFAATKWTGDAARARPGYIGDVLVELQKRDLNGVVFKKAALAMFDAFCRANPA